MGSVRNTFEHLDDAGIQRVEGFVGEEGPVPLEDRFGDFLSDGACETDANEIERGDALGRMFIRPSLVQL